jgi:hypothetical protein
MFGVTKTQRTIRSSLSGTEASFKRKEEQARQATKAWLEYEAQRRAVAEKTERLRALRLAKEAAESAAGVAKKNFISELAHTQKLEFQGMFPAPDSRRVS